MFSRQEVEQKRKNGSSVVARQPLYPRVQQGSWGQIEDTANHIHYTFSEWQTVKALGAAMREKLLSLLVNYPLRIGELLRLSIKQFIALENIAVLDLYQQAQSAGLDGGALLKEILEYSPENLSLLSRLARPSVQHAIIRGIMSVRDVASLPELTDNDEQHIQHAVEKYDRLLPRKGIHLPRFGKPPTFMKLVQKMGFNELLNPKRTNKSEPMCPFVTERLACVSIINGQHRITVPETHWGKYNALNANERYDVDWLVETYRIPYERAISLVSERCDLDGARVNVKHVLSTEAAQWIRSGRAFFDEVLLTGGYQRELLIKTTEQGRAVHHETQQKPGPRPPVQQKTDRVVFARSTHQLDENKKRTRHSVDRLIHSFKKSQRQDKYLIQEDSFSSSDESDSGSLSWAEFQAARTKRKIEKHAWTDISSMASSHQPASSSSDWEPFKRTLPRYNTRQKAKQSLDAGLPGMMPSRTVYTPKTYDVKPIDDKDIICQIFDPLPSTESPIFQVHTQQGTGAVSDKEARRQKRLAQLQELRAQREFDKEHQQTLPTTHHGRGDDTMGTNFKQRLAERSKAFCFEEQRATSTTYHREQGMTHASSTASFHTEHGRDIFTEADMADFDLGTSSKARTSHRAQRSDAPELGTCNPCEPDFIANAPSMLYSKTGQYGYAEALSKKQSDGTVTTMQTMEDAERRVQNIVTTLNSSTVMSSLEEKEGANGEPSSIHYRQVQADKDGFSYAQHTQCGSCVTEARFVTRGLTFADLERKQALKGEFRRRREEHAQDDRGADDPRLTSKIV